MYPDSEESNSIETSNIIPVTKHQQNVVNTLCNAQHLFQNAIFYNCNFTFQLPK